ncbi:hypothetical protein [Streptomyces hygroscopicus]|uniref:hypothetical protein n=1 Tax=Streptomyces hygroscopicus TaxID=1912 RepID=UPI002240B9DB|nr:hypothetical protein [Streptomyces hygroscopicus]
MGTVVVALAPHVICVVLATVQGWAGCAAGRSAGVIIGDSGLEVTGITAEQRQRLVGEFLRQTAAADRSGPAPDAGQRGEAAGDGRP